MFKKVKYKTGDIFVIPMHDQRFAICQVISALYERFKKVFSFGVLSIQEDEVYHGEQQYLFFTNYRGSFSMIVTASKLLAKGTWQIIDYAPLSAEQASLQYFSVSNHLYHNDDYIRILEISELQDYPPLAVAGYELVQKYLAQYP
ncbi:immunity 26/phosphotriesterase HocA family protein [Paenibacillus nuruki]|uniref:immunity 26/phosphotriesterase HocA family protein n=1 Tax=Paenibacillus nuruki TaxID=1886670 RepID=UPI0028061169|nr:immunity 26/phosphotriesterase HocA family protein [Paenibacillus nuruki]CAJ1315744.1 Transcriptional regulator [Paenibacillus nuruki]